MASFLFNGPPFLSIPLIILAMMNCLEGSSILLILWTHEIAARAVFT